MSDSSSSSSSSSLFPSILLDGYGRFCSGRLSDERERYAELSEQGQNPASMIISCCDSRCSPEQIFDCSPGEIFVVRNVANLVTAYGDGGDEGISAALEFAIEGLGVSHIIVLGHSRCGGVSAFRGRLMTEMGIESSPPSSPSSPSSLSSDDFVGMWTNRLRSISSRLEITGSESPDNLQRIMELESVRLSLDNLRSFPFVSSGIQKNGLSLHGAWFDISTAELWTLNPDTETFGIAGS